MKREGTGSDKRSDCKNPWTRTKAKTTEIDLQDSSSIHQPGRCIRAKERECVCVSISHCRDVSSRLGVWALAGDGVWALGSMLPSGHDIILGFPIWSLSTNMQHQAQRQLCAQSAQARGMGHSRLASLEPDRSIHKLPWPPVVWVGRDQFIDSGFSRKKMDLCGKSSEQEVLKRLPFESKQAPPSGWVGHTPCMDREIRPCWVFQMGSPLYPCQHLISPVYAYP